MLDLVDCLRTLMWVKCICDVCGFWFISYVAMACFKNKMSYTGVLFFISCSLSDKKKVYFPKQCFQQHAHSHTHPHRIAHIIIHWLSFGY